MSFKTATLCCLDLMFKKAVGIFPNRFYKFWESIWGGLSEAFFASLKIGAIAPAKFHFAFR